MKNRDFFNALYSKDLKGYLFEFCLFQGSFVFKAQRFVRYFKTIYQKRSISTAINVLLQGLPSKQLIKI